MKLKLLSASFAGLIASSLVAVAQTAASAGDNNSPATAPAPVLLAQADTTAPAAAPAPASTPDTNAAVVSRDPNAVMPLIAMEQTPLTDAIRNLARQAGLNYMLDPKIPFLQPGPDGRSQQPNVDLRLENVTANQALYALLNNYNLGIVDDPNTKIARITVKDPAAPDPLINKVIQLRYADTTNMVDSVKTVLVDKRSKVVADNRTSQLVLLATAKEIAAADELVARLDLKTPEVLIQAKLVETQQNPSSTKGVDWTGTLQAQHLTFGNGSTTGLTTATSGNTTASSAQVGGAQVGTVAPPFVGPANVITGTGTSSGSTIGQVLSTLTGAGGLSVNTAQGFFPYTAFLDSDGVSAVLSFLNTAADAKLLSTPSAVTLDNETATLSVTEATPIFNTTAGTQGSPGGSQVNYTNLGTILEVTPRISANDTINLHVVPQLSAYNSTVTKVVSGEENQADVFDERVIDTRVLIPSGNTLVMGGLVSDNSTFGSTKVPLLGDIPGLGWLFRQESKTQNKRNLIIFITPTIVHDEDFQPTQTDFLKTKPNDKPTADFGAWDSGKPQDWSKLFHRNGTNDDGTFPANN